MITAQDFEKAFAPFLEQIKDAALRAKVVETYVAACEEGGWKTIGDVEKMPFTLLTDTHGIGFLAHTRAVTAGAIGLAKAQIEHGGTIPYKIDMDVLVAAGLLHDVGKLTEFELQEGGHYAKSHAGRCARHPISGAIIAGKCGVPQEIINTIACHSKEGDGRPKRVETILVKQADFATFDPLTMLKAGTLI